MIDTSLFARKKQVTDTIDRLDLEALSLEEFDARIADLKETFPDVFALKGHERGLIPQRILWARAKIRAGAAQRAIDKTIGALSVTLPQSDLRIISAVYRAFSESRGGSKLLRTSMNALLELVKRRTESAAVGERQTVFSGWDAMTLRDALETALVDLTALREYDAWLSRAGDAGRGGLVVARAAFERILSAIEPEEERTVLDPAPASFRDKVEDVLSTAEQQGLSAVELSAGSLRAQVLGAKEPKRGVSVSCKALLVAMFPGDRVVSSPELNETERLTVRYRLPRRRNAG